MNRIVLVLNVIVLLTNFALAFWMTESQVGILDTTVRAANGPGLIAPRAGDRTVSTAYLRAVQSLDSIAPPSRETERSPEQYRALYDAVQAYYRVIDRSVATALFSGADPDALRRSFEDAGKAARAAVESEHEGPFGDARLVQRLATEVIRNCP
jgi:hypothetical protein